MNKSGIYQIRNTQTGRFYIGSAKNISKRWGVHRCQLNKGKHHSKKLQRAWSKYGEASFEFSVIEAVHDLNRLIDIEQGYLNLIKNFRRSYNANPVAGSSLGRSLSAETRAKIAKRRSGESTLRTQKQRFPLQGAGRRSRQNISKSWQR